MDKIFIKLKNALQNIFILFCLAIFEKRETDKFIHICILYSEYRELALFQGRIDLLSSFVVFQNFNVLSFFHICTFIFMYSIREEDFSFTKYEFFINVKNSNRSMSNCNTQKENFGFTFCLF